jgi:hypothetical protein
MREADVTTVTGISAFKQRHTLVATQLGELQAAAEREISEREDAWAPLAQELVAVVGHKERAVEAEPRFNTAKAAAAWLK